MSYKILLYLLFGVAFNAAHAAHVLPVFSGKWYTDAKYSYSDPCFKNHFTYKDLINGSPKDIVNNIIIKQQIPRGDCKWTSPRLETLIPQFEPDDFPGSDEEWHYFLDNSLYEKDQAWFSECIDKNQNTIDTASVEFYPKYECPKGSRFSINVTNIIYNESDYYGCSTTPDSCVSDVVGRDLDVTGFGSIGHIGLIELENNVIEVLNEPVVVQENSIEDFRRRSAYWGEKYGPQEHEDLTEAQSLRIFEKARNQKDCEVTYTRKWKYKPCKEKIPGYFRCDSFVYYAYKSGANIKIGEFTPFITFPMTIYSRLSHCRFDGSSSCNESLSDQTNYATQELITPLMPDRLLANNIQLELAKSEVSLQDLDKMTYDYVYSKEISRFDKITFLWNLLHKYKIEHNRFEYIESTLSDLEPYEIIPDIIASYRQTSDQYIKLTLLDLLRDAVSAKDFTKNNPNFAVAYSFFKQVLLNEPDPKILSRLISYYPLMDKEIYQIIVDKIEIIKKKDIDDCSNSIVFNSTFWGVLIQFMIDEKGKQGEWFDKIVALAEKYSEDPFMTQLPPRLQQEYRDNDFLVKDMFYKSLRNFMEDIKSNELEPIASKKIHDYLKNRITIRPLPLSRSDEYLKRVHEIIKKENEKREAFNAMKRNKATIF